METKDYFKNYLIKIKENLPHNNLLSIFIVLIKTIPLIILTHDWNLFYNKPFSHYISFITFMPIIDPVKHKITNQIIMGIYGLISVFTLISFIAFLKHFKEQKKIIYKKFFIFVCYVTFIFNFILAQYFYSAISASFLCNPVYDNTKSYTYIMRYEDNCRTVVNILIMIIQLIIFAYFLMISIFILIIISEPFAYTNNYIVTSINNVKKELIIFPLLQGFLVIEYIIPFKTCIFIKGILRGLYIVWFISYWYTEPKMFYSNEKFENVINFVYSVCFVSCIIEYMFLFDYKNDLIYLQTSFSIKIFKIISEFVLSLIITYSMKQYEKKCILDIIKGKVNNSMSYELLNKLFFCFYHVEYSIGDDLLYNVIETFARVFMDHKQNNKCIKQHGFKCYCQKYKLEDYYSQSECFLESVKTIRNNNHNNSTTKHNILNRNKILKNDFPILYKYFEYLQLLSLNKEKDHKHQASFLLGLAVFYVMFDKNYNISLLYLGEFMNTKYVKNSNIIKLQTKLITIQLEKDYHNNLIIEPEHQMLLNTKLNQHQSNFNTFVDMYKLYNSLRTRITLENQLNKTMQIYIDMLNYFCDNECSLDDLASKMKILSHALKQTNKMLLYLSSLDDTLKNNHICSKLTLYYDFFYDEVPTKITNCFFNIFQHDCKIDNYSSMIINTFSNKDSWKFIVEYVSDDLCEKLGYKLNEIKNKEISELFPNKFRKCFEFLILKKIRLGTMQMIMKEMVLADKDQYALLFDLIGIVIVTGEGSKIFFKVFSYNYDNKHKTNDNKQKTKNAHDNKNKNKKKGDNYNKQKVNRNECFVFVNEQGQIITISKEFESFFNLNLNTIKKFKINMFRDILKIENLNNKNIIKKNMIQIYENIADLSFELMQNSSSEEFARTYRHIKQIQSKLHNKKTPIFVVCQLEPREYWKNEREIKKSYYISFNLEIENDQTTFNAIQFNLGDTALTSNSTMKKPPTTKEHSSTTNTKIGSLNHKYSNNDINLSNINDKNEKQFHIQITSFDELLLKFRQVQTLSLKYLSLHFGLKVKEIFDINKQTEHELLLFDKTIENENGSQTVSSSTQSSNQNTNHHFLSSNNNTPQSKLHNTLRGSSKQLQGNGAMITLRKLNSNFIQQDTSSPKESISHSIKNKILIQLLIWILFSLIFLILQSVIITIDDDNNTRHIDLTSMVINSLLLRNLIYSIVSSMLRIQFVANGLQSETSFDNGFDNSIQSNKEKLYNRTIDMLEYYKAYEKYEFVLFKYDKLDIIDLRDKKFEYTTLKTDSLVEETSMISVVSQIHIKNFYIYENKIFPFNFNVSYDQIKDRELLESESMFVFAFEGYMSTLKYPWDEVDNMVIDNIHKDANDITIIVYAINISNGCLLFVLFIVQSFIYSKINNQIFARYYINYNYMEFFGSLLMRKVNQVKAFLENSDIEQLYKFQNLKIAFTNLYDDNNNFKENYEKIQNKLQVIIKPFKTIEITSYETHNLNHKDSFLSFVDMTEDINSTKNKKSESTSKIPIVRKKIIPERQTYLASNVLSVTDQGKSINNKLSSHNINPNNLNLHNLHKKQMHYLTITPTEGEHNPLFNTNSNMSNNNNNLIHNSLIISPTPGPTTPLSNNNTKQTQFTQCLTPVSTTSQTPINNNVTITNNNKIVTKANITNRMENKAKRDLRQPKVFYINLIAFSFTSLSVVIVCLINAIIVCNGILTRVEFSRVIKNALNLVTSYQEVLIVYSITLLKNTQLFHYYKSSGLLTMLEGNKFINSIENHDVLDECILKQTEINVFIQSKITENSNRYKHLKEYLENVNSPGSCEYYVNYYYKNLDVLIYPLLSSFEQDKDMLIQQCETIGKGINLDGQKDAFDSLINTISHYYNDFKNDENKTSENMMNRVRDHLFETFQAEVDLIMDKNMINYYLSWKQDYLIHNKTTNKYGNFFFAVIVLFIIIINCFYLWRFTFKFLEQNKIIHEIEPCIYNTIMF